MSLWLNSAVTRRSRPKYQMPDSRRKRRGGGLRWLMALALVAGAIWFWREHERPKKIVHAPAPVATKPQVQPLTVSRQSPTDFPHPVHDVLEAQIALARRGISPGSVDAALGSQTRAAISVFQETEHLPQTGKLDADTRAKLTLDMPVLTN